MVEFCTTTRVRVCVWLLFYFIGITSYYHGDPRCGETTCFESVYRPLLVFLSFLFPSTIALLFVRRQVIKAWSIFTLLYVFAGVLFLANQEVEGWISPRGLYAIFFGVALSIITILWSIIHTLILRHNEKKVGQTMTK